ncbi:MAG: hypothetical protein KY392_02795 [Chloroflexi bacterium]|nr:hypothetical protein [Chloroflexota bacterium]
MRLRSLVFLATVAALLGAPPSASAAVNLLHSPSASPLTGTTDTVFRLGVNYEGRFAARSVSATVGGSTVEMALIAGSSTSGTWQGGVRLPPGTWPVTFSADAERGEDPTLVGPILVVVGATPTPVLAVPATAPNLSSPSAADEPDGSARDTTDGSDAPVAASAATPAPAPQEATAPSASTSGGEGSPAVPVTAPAPVPSSAAEATAAGTPASGESDRAAEPAGGAEPAGSAARRHAPPPAPTARARGTDRGSSGWEGSDAARAEPESEHADDTGVLVEDELMMLSARTTAMWGALLLAVVAIGLGLVVRRRRRESSEADTLIASTEAEVILRRRAVRRGRLRVPDEDPIVASMDLRDRTGRRLPARRRPVRRENERD